LTTTPTAIAAMAVPKNKIVSSAVSKNKSSTAV